MSREGGRGEGLYRLLLRAYPAAFRARFEEELLELFRYRRDQRLRAEGRLGPGFWWTVARDLAPSAWAERRHPVPDAPGTDPTNRRGGDGMRGWMEDLGYATRRLARSPGFSLTALAILALGIGVSTAAFSFVNALLFQPPPFEEPERVVLVLQDSDGGVPNSTSYPAYLDIARFDVFESVSAYYTDQAFLERDGELVPILAEYATASYLQVLRLVPSRGRWFDVDEDDPSGPPAAVLTHRMWTDRLGADPDVVGSTLRIGGRTVTVVGVGPERFNGGTGPAPVDLWLSISAMGPTGGRVQSLTRRQDHPFRVRARLAPGVGVADAAAAMGGLAHELATTYPELNEGRGITVLTSMTPPDEAARVVPVAALAMAVVLLVLLIGTLNLANLLLVRTTARAKELAVRLALGAGRGRLARVVLTEAIVLAALGGGAGLGAAAWLAALLRKSRFDWMIPVSLDVRLDLRVALFAVALSAAAGLLFGLLPALRAASREVTASLHDEATTSLGARRRFGITGILVAGQVAASLLLLAVAGVVLESLTRAGTADPGFDFARTGYVSLSLQPLELAPEGLALLHDRLRERVEALPEVEAVTVAARVPGRLFGTTTLLLGSGVGRVDAPTEIPWNVVAPDYFDVVGVPLLAGRGFVAADFDGPTVAIVSEAMARTFWGRTDVVGERYRAESAPEVEVEIVGVVGNATVRALGEVPRPTVYWTGPERYPFGSYIFRTAGPPDGAIAAIRGAIAEVDERVLVLETAPVAHLLGSTLEARRLAGGLLGGLGTLALLLSVLGVYGVVSFAVSRRRHEVGIRIALGAGRPSVVRLFVRDVAAVVLVGGLAGAALAVPVSQVVARVFTGGSATPLAPAGAALLLGATALVATVVPALRAARTDPSRALRQE